jgi:hypothetical protein
METKTEWTRCQKMNDFLFGFAIGFATGVLLLIIWKWVKWELSGNWIGL